jgi:hypothetical protein
MAVVFDVARKCDGTALPTYRHGYSNFRRAEPTDDVGVSIKGAVGILNALFTDPVTDSGVEGFSTAHGAVLELSVDTHLSVLNDAAGQG